MSSFKKKDLPNNSSRDFNILEMRVEGHSIVDIAQKFNVKPKLVKSILSQIMVKFAQKDASEQISAECLAEQIELEQQNSSDLSVRLDAFEEMYPETAVEIRKKLPKLKYSQLKLPKDNLETFSRRIAIYQRVISGESRKDIANDFNVSVSAISKIAIEFNAYSKQRMIEDFIWSNDLCMKHRTKIDELEAKLKRTLKNILSKHKESIKTLIENKDEEMNFQALTIENLQINHDSSMQTIVNLHNNLNRYKKIFKGVSPEKAEIQMSELITELAVFKLRNKPLPTTNQEYSHTNRLLEEVRLLTSKLRTVMRENNSYQKAMAVNDMDLRHLLYKETERNKRLERLLELLNVEQ